MAEQSQVELLLSQGIAAVKGGRTEEARELLLQVLDLDEDNERAWLWMSAVTDGKDRIVCLKNVLAINPRNEYARLGLEALLGETVAPAQEVRVVPDQGSLPKEASPSAEMELGAAAEGTRIGTGRTRPMHFGLAILAFVTCAVWGVALLVGRMVITTGPWQPQPTRALANLGLSTAIPASAYTSTPTFTPTPTRVPMPTNTLVVPDARIPGLPIIREAAYPEIEARVCELRGLVSLREAKRQTFTRYRLEDYLSEVYHREEYVRDLEVSERIYQVLGLIDEEYDLIQMLIETQREGVAGLYDSEREEIYLILDRYTSDLWLEVTFAHEFAHALQDQHFDLDSLQSRTLTTDSRLALQALIEGDATLVMVQYAFEYLFRLDFERSDLLEAIQQVEQGEYQDAPGVVRETAWFPYSQGVIFAAALVEEGGWTRLDEAFRSPPQTTEQIMHPDKYLSGELAYIPEVGDLLDGLGPGWAEARRDVIGQLFIRVYLQRELESEEALMAAEGWEGDRLLFLENDENDSYALILRTTWDTTASAEEFFSFYMIFMQRAGARSRTLDKPQRKEWRWEDQVTYLSRQDHDVLVVLAPDEETLGLVLTELSTF
jgi:hypothetical protein